MLLSIAAFECRYLLRSPQAWCVFLAFFALGTLSLGYLSGEGASDLFSLGRNVQFNSPFYLAVSLSVLGTLAVFVAPQFVGEAVIRDTDCHFDGIVFTTAVSKFSYLYGRFLGGFGALLVSFLGAPLGMILCPLWAFRFAEGSLAPFTPAPYFIALLVYTLPTLLLFSSLVFLVAVVTRRLIYTHLVSLAVVVLLLVGMAVTARLRLAMTESAPFLAPLLTLLSSLPSYWTPAQLNTSLLSTDPWSTVLLMNRLMVTLLALYFLGLSYRLFSFTRRAAGPRRTRQPAGDVDSSALPAHVLSRSHPAPTAASARVWLAFLLRTRFEFTTVLWSLPCLALLLINVGLMLDRLSYAAEVSFPETFMSLNVLSGVEPALFLMATVLVFAPELFWREHKDRIHEILHALPVPNWVFVASKLLALFGIVIAVLAVNLALILFFQAGEVEIDYRLYLAHSLYLLLPYLCFAVLASFLQVVANHRFVGSALTAAYLLTTFALFAFGFQHPLYQNVMLADSAVPLSGMDSTTSFPVRGYWLRVYWAGITGVVLLLTYALYSRGILQPWQHRWKHLQQFKSTGFYVPAAASILVALGAGSFIYYNTNVLNRYSSSNEIDAQLAQYEKLYRQYEALPLPRITDVDMTLDLFPDRRRLEFSAELSLVNTSAQPLNAVHLTLPVGIEFETMTLEGATLRSLDVTHFYAIHDLAAPMLPGERRLLSMKGYRQVRGFRAANEDTTLVDNGSHFEIAALIPHIGFSVNRVLTDPATREQYGLERSLPLGTLDEDRSTSRYFNNSGMRSDSDLVNFAATLSTVEGQTAVTAGRLTAEWQANGRHYFRYRTDTPVLLVIPFFSARYAVLRDRWGDVDIEIYYHPDHNYHVDLMMQALKDGLTKYSADYGPYQYQQLRVLEYPGYRSNSRSLPTAIAHSEVNGFIQRDPAENYETMAHELAHHWWGHQVLSARVEGVGVLSEGFASYSARMLMEAKYGKEFALHRNAVSANRRYLRGRNNDPLGERPLYRSAAQDYLDYYKGESVLYALQNHIGEDVVNAALREFVTTYRNHTRPYVVFTDFLAILKRQAGPDHLALIEDFFERITLYEFAVETAKAEALNDGRYRITLAITTAKRYGDDHGSDTAAEFDSPVNIGLFMKHPRDPSFRVDEDVILLDLLSPGNGASTLEFIVDQLPAFAGINPYDVLLERDATNNVVRVGD